MRVEDLEALALAAAGATDLRRFVSELVLDPPSSSADLAGPPHLDEDYLVLSTAHSAKGLEWEAVHLIAAYDGNFPADMAISSEEGLAEERRLFYVALTRARRRLHVYAPRRFYHRPSGRDDGHGLGQPSRFLTEEVQRLFSLSTPAQAEQSSLEHDSPRAASNERLARAARARGAAAPARRIEVSLDALFS